MLDDIEMLQSEVRGFVQSCGEADDIADDVLKGLLELYRLTGRPVQELWREHLRSICCLEWMALAANRKDPGEVDPRSLASPANLGVHPRPPTQPLRAA